MSRLGRCLSVRDFEREARRIMPRCVEGYVCGGTEDGASLDESVRALRDIGFRPRGLRVVDQRSSQVSLFGQDYAMPMGFAPTGFSAIVMHECDLALARAAQDARIPFIISGASSVPLERLQQATGKRCWYQAYLPGNTDRIAKLLARLRQAEIPVLVVTIDTCVGANRENLQRLAFTVPFKMSPSVVLDGMLHPRWTLNVFLRTLFGSGVPRFSNLYEEIGPPITQDPPNGFRGERDKLSWEHIRWIRDNWPGKLVLKGVMHADDARQAWAVGADGVIVSNHGGRQLDGCISPLQALPDVAAAVPPGFPVMVDGGFRRGSDVLKAVALGARLVFTGRPQLFGAAVGGDAGIRKVAEIFRSEISTNMALLGCRTLADVTPDLIAPIRPAGSA
ncbi:alpha-hydroxy-acid oxidizing protein [Achromobacter denitrificans]|jgi:L-lactate dehydrogenase (cytochrome)|uniref:Alpha-hydroxy acid oxidase n=1 Tax=Achromobacter denitrificans TaxID=32002 RepID=A0A3R9FK81_ACHDE|nr:MULTISPECIES: alpha-hydroxy acid oxidase [Achromobacter]MBV2160768.1 alpha-hydroxy-acid oxidizing protein [Achromobacter denitrificans]MDF3847536.1 alpha-hydroxy acid oxidase [Achromobacter denitrificans]MDF3862146.1 alpha-hydroxy acid oxidase [Achromobacter denitrificans]MDF3939679.1 alpha-hydroxy acid oxidase [Achromobacter denitrificans]MDX3880675.1 alpha-hydroxy acid oxidase [Achromobacter sp.]